MQAAPDERRLQCAFRRELRAINDPDDDDGRDEAEGRDRGERGGEGRIGDAGIGADHHVLRVAGDRGHAAAVRGGRGRDEVGQRIAPERPRHGEHDRRHDEGDRVVDQEGGKDAGEQRHRREQRERPVGVLDRQHAQRVEGARNFQVRDHDRHAEQERDGVDVDGAEGLFERQRAAGDHRRPAEQRNPGAVEPQARKAAERGPEIGEASGIAQTYAKAVQYAEGSKVNLWPELAHAAISHVPFSNLFYVKGAYDYLLAYHVLEAAQPGWWERTNQRLKQETGSTMTGYSPGAGVPYGIPGVYLGSGNSSSGVLGNGKLK